MPKLVKPVGKFFVLHSCIHSKFLMNMENNKSAHGENIGYDYNGLFQIKVKTFQFFHRSNHFSILPFLSYSTCRTTVNQIAC